MFQVISADETYRTVGCERARQCVTLTGRRLDGTLVQCVVEDVKHEVYWSVDDEYSLEQAEIMAVKLNNYLLKNKHRCKRTGCCSNEREQFTINTEACILERNTDIQAVVSASLVKARSFTGFQEEEGTFVKFILTRSYYANSKLVSFLGNGTVYECNDKCVDSFLTVMKCGGFSWFYDDGQPVPSELCPPQTERCPLVTFVWDIETPCNTGVFPRPEDGVEIGSIVYCIGKDDYYGMMVAGKSTREVDNTVPDLKLTIYDTERDMLVAFHEAFMRADPDIFAGYNSNKFDIPFVVKRMKMLGLPQQWSRVEGLSLIMHETKTSSNQKGTRDVCTIYLPGRIVMDAFLLVVDDMTIKCSSKKLGDVGNYLGLGKKEDLHHSKLWPYHHGTSKQRGEVMKYNYKDVWLTKAIMEKRLHVESMVANCGVFKVSPQSDQSRGITYHISQLIYYFAYPRYLRLHMEYGPRKVLRQKETEVVMESVKNIHPILRAKPLEMKLRGFNGDYFDESKVGYEGGFVLGKEEKGEAIFLEPGRYSNCVAVGDFRSLYPSIIERHNICHTTLLTVPVEEEKDGYIEHQGKRFDATGSSVIIEHNGRRFERSPNKEWFLIREERVGIIPEVVRFLVAKRNEVKALQKKEEEGSIICRTLDAIQNAYKIAANATYGLFGSPKSMLGALIAADAVTSFGRWYIKSVMSYLKYKVLYGDTDSVFFHIPEPNVDEAWRKFKEAIREVNEESGLLKRPMELGCDSLNTEFIIMGSKQYTMMTVLSKPGEVLKTKIITKGMGMIKGDSIPYVREIGKETVMKLLQGEWTNEVFKSELGRHVNLILKGELPRESFILQKKLSKSVEDYASDEAHVVAAKQLMAVGHQVLAGDVIDYYLCVTPGMNHKKSSMAVPSALADDYVLNWEVYAEKFTNAFESLIQVILNGDFDMNHYRPLPDNALTRMLGMTRRRVLTHAPQPKKKMKQFSLDDFFTTT